MKNKLTIRDLQKLSGYSARSIHHYISRSLLPNPDGSGPAARYGRQHLLRLKLIEHAKGSGFKVDQRLQELLDGLSLAEMEELVALAEGVAPEDIRTFGEWLMTGEWRPDRRKPAAKSLAGRLPSTAALLKLGQPSVADSADAASFAEESFASYSAYPGDEPERWERVRFGDSVEISWRQSDGDPTSERKVKQLLDKAAKIFK